MKVWIKDPKTGKLSVTLTLLVVGFAGALGKLVAAGTQWGSTTMGPFSGADFAAVMAALGALYWGRKHTDTKPPATPGETPEE